MGPFQRNTVKHGKKSMSNASIESEEPVFITGVYRSGTTLITRVLDLHSQLAVTYDSVQYLRFYYDQYDKPSSQFEEIVSSVADRLRDRYSIELDVDSILSRITGDGPVTHARIYNSIMKELLVPNKKVRWGEKSVLEWTAIPEFLTMFPRGKVLHVIRDPRDVLASYRENTIEEQHRYLDAVFACLHSFEWADNEGGQISDDSYKIVRHEDLVQETRETIDSICDFLGVSFEEVMLDTSRFTNKKGESTWDGNSAFGDVQASKGFDPSSTGRWKNHLSDQEVLLTESIIGDLMERFEYPHSDRKMDSSQFRSFWDQIRETPLIQERLHKWFETGEGIEEYPSDPLNPENWGEAS